MENVLKKMPQRSLIMGIETDILCPVREQEFLAQHIPNSELIIIDSDYGHDGFLTERAQITLHLNQWLKEDSGK